jgi:hypothetical protein
MFQPTWLSRTAVLLAVPVALRCVLFKQDLQLAKMVCCCEAQSLTERHWLLQLKIDLSNRCIRCSVALCQVQTMCTTDPGLLYLGDQWL